MKVVLVKVRGLMVVYGNILIEEIKNLDMRVFIEFQRMIHEEETFEIIRNSKIDLDSLSLEDILSFAD